MRIISFSPAPIQALWTLPAQALAPWITRIRHSFGQSPVSFLERRSARAAPSCFLPRTATASNDALFNIASEMANRSDFPRSPKKIGSVLRVVRESDAAIRPDCAGRMVISGRMADVCAELDRMALQAESTVTD